ncbi:hypothetical protein BKA64DRAFT_661253 [Cadophora sp. MPI-SDFR-AT-0126]|nr:hypothetical protein BKA64DRAFT_661253 [Leotiomycetes sp. MPI-SDFR-AT-0126]
MECILQILALLLSLFALPYLTFPLAFYAVAVPGLLMYFYYKSPATENLTSLTRPHGLQAVIWDEPVPAWAKHLWWIVPSFAALESVQIVQHSGAIYQHFRDYDFEFFSEAWASSSIISLIAVGISTLLTFLVHVVEEPHTLEFLWAIGNIVTDYLPFHTRPLRDALLFRAGAGTKYQGRKPVDMIHAWIVLVLQAYRPGAGSLVVSMLVWDIVKVNKSSTASPTPPTPLQDDNGVTPANDESGLKSDQRAKAAASAVERVISKARMSEQRSADAAGEELPAEAAEHEPSEAKAEIRKAEEEVAKGMKGRREISPTAAEEQGEGKDRSEGEADQIRIRYLEDEQARLARPQRFSSLVDDGPSDDFGLDPEAEDQVLNEGDEASNPGNRDDLSPGNLDAQGVQLPMQTQSTIESVPEPEQPHLAAQTGSGPSM